MNLEIYMMEQMTKYEREKLDRMERMGLMIHEGDETDKKLKRKNTKLMRYLGRLGQRRFKNSRNYSESERFDNQSPL